MYITQAINTITSKCVRICKQTYRKLTQQKVHTPRDVKTQMECTYCRKHRRCEHIH